MAVTAKVKLSPSMALPPVGCPVMVGGIPGGIVTLLLSKMTCKPVHPTAGPMLSHTKSMVFTPATNVTVGEFERANDV